MGDNILEFTDVFADEQVPSLALRCQRAIGALVIGVSSFKMLLRSFSNANCAISLKSASNEEISRDNQGNITRSHTPGSSVRRGDNAAISASNSEGAIVS